MLCKKFKAINCSKFEDSCKIWLPLLVDEALALLGSAQRMLVTVAYVTGQPFGSIFKGEAVDPRPLMGRIGCPETSVNTHQRTLRNNPEEQVPHSCTSS